jgi:hypothetical protein
MALLFNPDASKPLKAVQRQVFIRHIARTEAGLNTAYSTYCAEPTLVPCYTL